MNIEYIIQAIAWIVVTLLLFFLVPKEKIREAQVIFFFKQVMSWLLGYIVVELNLIKYPIRFFPNAGMTSFTFEYYIYPGISVLFNLYYPQGQTLLKKLIYYSLYCSGITILEVLLELYTNTIVYVHWTWYLTWITLFLTFFASREYYKWFFGIKSPKR